MAGLFDLPKRIPQRGLFDNVYRVGGSPDDQLQNMIEGDTSPEGSFQPGEIEPLTITPNMGAIEGGGRLGLRDLYHGSPVAGLTRLTPSTRGPLGPGVYVTPTPQTAGIYKRGDAGNVYQLPTKPRNVFLGSGYKTDDEYYTWLDDKKRLIEAVEPDKRPLVEKMMDRMHGSDGYPIFARLSQMLGGDEAAQTLFKKAGFEGISAMVDGHEVVLFGEQMLGGD
jgi:hypothetical protein